MINFKKVVGMAVVLSLMLGACGKNPARRDDELVKASDQQAPVTDKETLKGTFSECCDEINFWSEKNKGKGWGKLQILYPAGKNFSILATIVPAVVVVVAEVMLAINGGIWGNPDWDWLKGRKMMTHLTIAGTGFAWFSAAQSISAYHKECQHKDNETWMNWAGTKWSRFWRTSVFGGMAAVAGMTLTIGAVALTERYFCNWRPKKEGKETASSAKAEGFAWFCEKICDGCSKLFDLGDEDKTYKKKRWKRKTAMRIFSGAAYIAAVFGTGTVAANSAKAGGGEWGVWRAFFQAPSAGIVGGWLGYFFRGSPAAISTPATPAAK